MLTLKSLAILNLNYNKIYNNPKSEERIYLERMNVRLIGEELKRKNKLVKGNYREKMFCWVLLINIGRFQLNEQGMGSRRTSAELMELFFNHPEVMKRLIGNVNNCNYCQNNELYLCDIHSNWASWERCNSYHEK